MPGENTETESTDPRAYTREELDQLLAERIEAVRKEEKDKLYGTKANQDEKMRLLNEQVSELTKTNKEREKEAARIAKAKSDADRKAEEAELSAKELIAKREADWEAKRNEDMQLFQNRTTELEQRLESEKAIRAQEAALAELREYVQYRVSQEADNIEPHLVKYVNGTSREEIDASIEQLKADSAGIYQAGQEHFRGTRAAMPGSAPTGNIPSGPMEALDQGQQQQFSAEEIKAMDQDTYLKHRAGLLRAAGGGSSGSGVGLFG